jgi:hypothetical protein
MLLAPFLDGGQRILDVFFRVGIGVGVKNLSLGRNHIGNAVGEGRLGAEALQQIETALETTSTDSPWRDTNARGESNAPVYSTRFVIRRYNGDRLCQTTIREVFIAYHSNNK